MEQWGILFIVALLLGALGYGLVMLVGWIVVPILEWLHDRRHWKGSHFITCDYCWRERNIIQHELRDRGRLATRPPEAD